MNPSLEPFIYEAAVQRQSELRDTGRPGATTDDEETPRPAGIRLRWCPCDRLTAALASR